jgi:hypothetical protein
MIRYLNTKLNGVTETLDSVSLSDFKDYDEFRKYKKYLISEYCLAGGHGVMYWSQRACK